MAKNEEHREMECMKILKEENVGEKAKDPWEMQSHMAI